MDNNDVCDGLRLVIEQDGETYTRVYRRSDTKDGMIIVGRLSGLPNEGIVEDDPVGGTIVTQGVAAFVCPVMSRQHARLVFGSDGSVFVSDPPEHSHHGTFITRGSEIFRVGHPQRLQTGDVITFGKAVHRGGDVYPPLTAKVELLSVPSLSTSPTSSFTGRGYGLPPNIDNQSAFNEEEVDEIEDHSSHKYFAVEELPSDDEDIQSTSDVEIQCRSDVEIITTPPRDILPLPLHAHGGMLGRSILPPSWTIPKPIRPSQTFIQSHQPTSQDTQSQLQLQEQIRAFMALTDSPWCRLRGDSQPPQPIPAPRPVSPLSDYLTVPITAARGLDDNSHERERQRAVALEVLREQCEIVDVDAEEGGVMEPTHEFIDADAFPTPEPEVVCVETLARALANAPRDEFALARSDPADQVINTSTDELVAISVANASAAVGAEAPFHLDGSESEGDGEDGLVDDDYDEDERMPVTEMNGDDKEEDEEEEDDEDSSKTFKKLLDHCDFPEFESGKHSSDMFAVLTCLKKLSAKVAKLEGSRNRSKRRFALHKTQFDSTLAEMQKKYDTLQAGLAVKELIDTNRAYEERKDELMNDIVHGLDDFKDCAAMHDVELRNKVDTAMKHVDEVKEDVTSRKDIFLQDVDTIKKEARATIDAEMESFKTAVNSALTVINNARDCASTTLNESRKRKREEADDDASSLPESSTESVSALLTASTGSLAGGVVEPLGCLEATVGVNVEGSAVAPPPKRRRIVRTAAHVLVGGAMVYLGLGML
ncbi:hypothetical protein FRB96_008428 [Tulasnella sp. 330]|nr:hypothetical protein FRB96_008428 [Tulasnella sp. 330]